MGKDKKEITYSYTELNNRISELETMKSEWETYSSTVKPEKDGDGLVIYMIDKIGTGYDATYLALCTLLDNTIDFLKNVLNSVEKTDNNAANKIEKGGH